MTVRLKNNNKKKTGSRINTSDKKSKGARSDFLFAFNLNNFRVDE